MKALNFPLCCGAVVLCDFGHTPTTHGTGAEVPLGEIEKFLAEPSDEELVGAKCGKAAFQLAILNSDQHAALHDLMTKAQFHMVSEGHNSYSARKNYLYVRVRKEQCKLTNPVQYDPTTESLKYIPAPFSDKL